MENLVVFCHQRRSEPRSIVRVALAENGNAFGRRLRLDAYNQRVVVPETTCVMASNVSMLWYLLQAMKQLACDVTVDGSGLNGHILHRPQVNGGPTCFWISSKLDWRMLFHRHFTPTVLSPT